MMEARTSGVAASGSWAVSERPCLRRCRLWQVVDGQLALALALAVDGWRLAAGVAVAVAGVAAVLFRFC